jgi:hypothetical protein
MRANTAAKVSLAAFLLLPASREDLDERAERLEPELEAR